jgi:type II secretory pathway component PulF
MAIFHCRVADSSGKIIEFVREASTPDALSMELINKGYSPLAIRESQEESQKKIYKKYSRKSILEFTDTISVLINSGLSLKDALAIAQTIFLKGNENQIIVNILERLQKGMSFHHALETFGGSFPPLYTSLVRIGEKVGTLEQILKRLSKYLHDAQTIREKIIGALIYPLMLVSIVFVGLIMMVLVVFPTLQHLFSTFGAHLTRNIDTMLLSARIFITIVLLLVVGSIVLAIAVWFIRKRKSPLTEKVDWFILRIPLIGRAVLYRESLNFLFAMETLTGSGFTLEEALQEAAHVVKNLTLKSALLSIKERIIKGDSISEAFLEQKLFPERIGRWLAVGERSGNVEQVFSQLSTYYQAEIEKWSDRFMAWIQPAIMLLVGAFIILFVVLFILPIFSMYGEIM